MFGAWVQFGFGGVGPELNKLFHSQWNNLAQIDIDEEGKESLMRLAQGDMRKVLNILQVQIKFLSMKAKEILEICFSPATWHLEKLPKTMSTRV